MSIPFMSISTFHGRVVTCVFLAFLSFSLTICQAAPSGAFMEMVHVPGGFSAGKYDVTQAQYEAIMGRNPSSYKGPRKPVENVSWEDAIKFCKLLTEQERTAGRLPAGMVYSLPTEAQWTAMVGGASLDSAVTSLHGARSSTSDVGSMHANKYGLYDMRGNVWQWCYNPVEPDSDSKVIRGGSFANSEPEKLAVDYRQGLTPLFKIGGIGFRCVLVPESSRK